jgi:tetratricopeptide (TPR) repeat protein
MHMDSNRRDRRYKTSNLSSLKPILIAIGTSILSACAFGAHAQSSDEEDLQEQIHKYEAISAQADPPAMSPIPAGLIWTHLGQLYEDAAMYPQSESAYGRAIRLLKAAPGADAERASAIDGLGTLYMMWGDTSQAERAELEALSIRQTKGLTPDLAKSWYHLSELAQREHKLDKARDYAQRAVDQLETEPAPNADEEINARFTLGVALCGLRRYPEAIAMMRAAMEIVHRTDQPGDLSTGFGSFVLGFTYWKSGDLESARSLMKDGAATIQKQLGWSHPVCRALMYEYRQYLRNTHQKDEARAIGDELKQHGGTDGLRPGQGTLSIEALF